MTISSLFLGSKIVYRTTPPSARVAGYSAGGNLLDGTAESVLQGFITDDCGEQHLARIAILNMSGIEVNCFSVKATERKGIVLIVDISDPRLEAADSTLALRGEDDDFSSFKLEVSAGGYAGKELAINAVANPTCTTGSWVFPTSAALNS